MSILIWTTESTDDEDDVENYSQAVIDASEGVIAQIWQPCRGFRTKLTWCIWEGECNDVEVVAGTAADADSAKRAIKAECDERGLWPIVVPTDLDLRGVITRMAAMMRTKFDEADALAEPTYKTLEDLASAAEMMSSELLAYANDLGPEEVPVRGLFYALGDPPSIDLQPEQTLSLQREPGNQKDPKAIGLFAECGTRVGYVPAGIAEYLAPQLDECIPATAWLSRGEGTDWRACLSGPAVLAMRAARKAEQWQQGDDIPF